MKGIDRIDPAYYAVADGDRQTTTPAEAKIDMGGDGRSAAVRRAPVLHATESDSRPSGFRRLRRVALLAILRWRDRPARFAARAADSFALRGFLGLVLPEAPPDHSTISRTRRLIDLETHQAVFTWLLVAPGSHIGAGRSRSPRAVDELRNEHHYPRGFAPRTPRHALSLAAAPARADRVARSLPLARLFLDTTPSSARIARRRRAEPFGARLFLDTTPSSPW